MKILPLLVLLTSPLSAQILPIDRQSTWNPGLLSLGGVPTRPTICSTINASTYGSGTVEASAGIQAALDICPLGQTVKLSAGTFLLNDYIRLGRAVTLRGSGPGQTILKKTNGAIPGSYTPAEYDPIVIIGPSRWPGADNATSQNLTANGVRGALSVTVASGVGFAPNQFVLIDSDDYTTAAWLPLPNRNGSPTTSRIWASDRTVFMRHSPADPVDDPFPSSLTWFSRANRPVSEIKQVASVSGNVITFTSPLYTDYPLSKSSQLTRYTGDSIHIQGAGVEDMTLTGGSDGNVRFLNAAYSWAKNLESTIWLNEAFAINGSYRVEIRDSYVHDGAWSAPGGGGYALSLSWASSEALIENNIIMKANKMMVGRSAGAGSVVAYNYADDGLINYDLSWQEVGLNGSHMVGSHHWLFEGNQSFNYDSDNTHGNAVSMTVFRNHLSGFRRSYPGMSNARTAGLMFGSWWHSFIGNVLGLENQMSGWVYEDSDYPWNGSAVWKLGYDPTHWEQTADPKALSTTLREGNFDYLTNAVRWDTSAQTIPPSLYLASKPSFFGALPWPWVDPLGATKLHTLPARARFDAGPIPVPTPTPTPTPIPTPTPTPCPTCPEDIITSTCTTPRVTQTKQADGSIKVVVDRGTCTLTVK